ncbi:NeuD/PglB/VioB family sugar acetyltransferase [Halomicrobium sp. IBSBa]|uniref:NeuD/PglB/VioB family sugar acetyltransferase n=1 Tax=Halomicrobium sp. IBSBa TaxID=2778916 RepID=UPI001ABF316D|nr:NeuD/PglB/VioB family sugar acetyltransferase [Halomicrobium sp. IBSBa]MBO4249536.1 NeuD/PglB/VioB family sugar acetyltransferase [Halomicrobium sp. IBSBa]
MYAIYCAGDQGRVVRDIVQASDKNERLVFVDDNPELHGTEIGGIPVVGGLDYVSNRSQTSFHVAYGSTAGNRTDIAARIEKAGFSFFNAIHPDATISESANLGEGVAINAQSYVGPGSDVGDHVLIDSCVNISHDSALGDGVTVTPNVGIAGNVTIEAGAYVGPGAVVFKGTTIGRGAVVGGGAVVTSDVEPETEVRGIPAKSIDDR